MGLGFYDGRRYGTIQRNNFGFPLTKGGDAASAFTVGSATTTTHVSRWYPKGPVDIKKVGCRVMATLASAANATGSVLRQRAPIKIYKSNAAGTAKSTLIASFHVVMGDGGRTALFGVASKESMASAEVEAGRFLTIFQATANSDNGSLPAATGTTFRTGSLAFFIDWTPRYDSEFD